MNFLSIVDDYSRKLWIYIQKTKDEAFDNFKSWKTLVENQTGRKIKRLHIDNGLEFYSEPFNDFCKENGIARHRTVAGTPQQNGLAERFNVTILERVRCMLLSAKLPKIFWAEAIMTAVYLINKCPSTALNFKTPEEIWSGHPPSLKQLKVFGCVAYAHIKQDKLEPRVVKCIFLGYPEGVKGYKLWCLEAGFKRCLVSRDVVFNEAEMAYKTKPSMVQSSTDQSKETDSEKLNFEVETEDKHVETQVVNWICELYCPSELVHS